MIGGTIFTHKLLALLHPRVPSTGGEGHVGLWSAFVVPLGGWRIKGSSEGSPVKKSYLTLPDALSSSVRAQLLKTTGDHPAANLKESWFNSAEFPQLTPPKKKNLL